MSLSHRQHFQNSQPGKPTYLPKNPLMDVPLHKDEGVTKNSKRSDKRHSEEKTIH